MTVIKVFLNEIKVSWLIAAILNMCQTILVNLILGGIYIYIFDETASLTMLLLFTFGSSIYFLLVIPYAGYFMEKFTIYFGANIKKKVFDKLMKAENHSYNNMYILDYDVKNVAALTEWRSAVFGQAIISGVVALIIMAFYSLEMMLILIVTAILTMTGNYLINKKIVEMIKKIREQRKSRNKFLSEIVSNSRSILLNNQMLSITERLKRESKKLYDLEKKYQGYNAVSMFLNGMSSEIIIKLVVVGYGSYLISMHRLPIHSLMLMLQISTGFTFFVSSFASLLKNFQNSLISKEEIDQVLSLKSSSRGEEKAGKIENIEIENLTVAYKDSDEIVNGFMYDFKFPGNYIVRGENGKGKSTLIKSILGQTNIIQGDIIIAGNSIVRKKIDFSKSIGYVPQNVVIFSDTIWNNVFLGRISGDSNQLNELIDYVELRQWLENVNLNVQSKEIINNEMFSEGEKKRFALLRALVTNPQVILLDEFDANLDDDTSIRILNKVLEDYDTIMISHNKELHFNNSIVEI